MRRINLDDEIEMSARRRGHTYGDGDVIVGYFEAYRAQYGGYDDDCTATVRYGHETGYVRDDGMNLDADWILVEWRYATDAEIDAFEDAERTVE
jgi:hypothetical protein